MSKPQLELDLIEPPSAETVGWQPPEPPSLDGVDTVYLDVEATGLRWWDGDKLVGLAIATPDGRAWYLPDSHLGGGNLPPGVLKRWCQRELRNKRVVGLNIRFDNHTLYEFGVDLVEQGCTFGDVGHYAALLDDHRTKFSLDSIAKDYLGEGKVSGLDVGRIRIYHAGRVEKYATTDVLLPMRLDKKMQPLLDAQNLQEVRKLEDSIIPVVCEMERNGSPIDQRLLEQWCNQTEQEVIRLLSWVREQTGLNVSPSSRSDMNRLFWTLNLNVTKFTEKGEPSYDDLSLKQFPHPVIKAIRRAKKLESMRSKYFLKYREETKRSQLLRYALHQLKAEYGNEMGGRQGGTVTGRFSSSGFGTKIVPDGINVQQVMTTERARAAMGYAADSDEHDDEVYPVRRLYVPEPGKLWLSADADQIEYRLFAHYSAAPVVLKAYADDPRANFHKIIQKMLQQIRPDIPYRRTKDINFAKIYGASLRKIALMMEMPEDEARDFVRAYDRLLPEVPRLIEKAMRTAETRGFVRTLLGRRMRFPQRERLHKALNGVIQGGAADWNKMKLVELFRERKRIGLKMRFTVHDEVNGDVPDVAAAKMVEEILNRQTHKLRVPITWSVGTGANWAEAKEAA